MDQRRFAREASDPPLGAPADDRQQLLEAPDIPGALVERAGGDRLPGALVVVVDVESFTAGRALEGAVQQWRPVTAVAADEFGGAGAGPGPQGLGAMRIYRVTHDSSFAAD